LYSENDFPTTKTGPVEAQGCRPCGRAALPGFDAR
jgi:hypothetical protein